MLAKLINGAANFFRISTETATNIATAAGILGAGGFLNKAIGNPARKIKGYLKNKLFSSGKSEPESFNDSKNSTSSYPKDKSYNSKYQSNKHDQILSDKNSGGLWNKSHNPSMFEKIKNNVGNIIEDGIDNVK